MLDSLDKLYYKLVEYGMSENLEEKRKLAQEIVKMTNDPEILKRMDDYMSIYLSTEVYLLN